MKKKNIYENKYVVRFMLSHFRLVLRLLPPNDTKNFE